MARRFDHHRGRGGRSFAHHAEAARLAPPEQDHRLREAERRTWPRTEPRRSDRADRAEHADHAGPAAQAGTDGPSAADGEEYGARRTAGQIRRAATLTIESTRSVGD
ncbi:hypothetical protein ACIRJR_33380 [Streptomyces sp. NPDC102402]|uniref:hypothetical protein n=1 Tax=Streptomyces sp. NPDC102402 TaxID=3366169 RepID=UPI0038122D35